MSESVVSLSHSLLEPDRLYFSSDVTGKMLWKESLESESKLYDSSDEVESSSCREWYLRLSSECKFEDYTGYNWFHIHIKGIH